MTHYKCFYCKEITPKEDWKEGYIHCDLCNEHEGVICPKCDRVADNMWNDFPTEVTK